MKRDEIDARIQKHCGKPLRELIGPNKVEDFQDYVIRNDLELEDKDDVETALQGFEKHNRELWGETKPRVYGASPNRGSIFRLYQYIQLRRQLEKEGLPLKPHLKAFAHTKNLSEHYSAIQKANVTASSQNDDRKVVSIKFTLELERFSSTYKRLTEQAYYSQPANKDRFDWWLKGLTEFIKENPEAFKLDVSSEHTSLARLWRVVKGLGLDLDTYTELLEGTPAVIQLTTNYLPTLVFLDPDLPPTELEKIWDEILVEQDIRRKTQGPPWKIRSYHHELEAYQKERWPEYWKSFVERHAREGISDEKLEELFWEKHGRDFLDQTEEAFWVEKNQKRKKLEAKLRKRQRSQKRARGEITRRTEILGRIAYDVTLEGLYFGEKGFVEAVLKRYRQQASWYGLDPDHYKVSTDGKKAIRQALRRLEDKLRDKGIKFSFERPSMIA